MIQRGRGGTADLSVVPIAAADARPEPPQILPAGQAEEWRSVVSRMPADWFKREHYGQLEAYCGHVTRHRLLQSELARLSETGFPSDFETFNEISKAAERESRAMIALARTLRITHQAQYDPKTAARSSRGSSDKVPWEHK